MKIKSLDFLLEPVDKNRLAYLIGPEDENLRLLEERLNLTIAYSGAHFHLEGESDHALTVCKRLLRSLYLETAPAGKSKAREVTPEMVHLALVESHVLDREKGEDKTAMRLSRELDGLYAKSAELHTNRGTVRARTAHQSEYLQAIASHDVTFGVGPAGTGKTYLAVAAAVDALNRNEIRRIILTRPAIEAGEKLGFLPGDLTQKVDPYLRPLYDALYEMLGFEKVQKFIERQIIEIAPLAYMRGRTLNDSFIILDESQNTTIEQMKMFLTRIGFNSRAVITGDPSQIDLPHNVRSGLRHALTVLEGIESIAITYLDASDVVRHPVVAAIVSAYAAFEEQEEAAREQKRRERLEERRRYSADPRPVYGPTGYRREDGKEPEPLKGKDDSPGDAAHTAETDSSDA
ncbi:MAG TPA: PhoH family protein [Candidatus Avisuccinivibrio pullicola]|nr:PhoH family protein [Candidatus Avisuccinivibrio pullicola]